jgi:outer membrane lipopolysaccharide assembly protein LptE/RlpB
MKQCIALLSLCSLMLLVPACGWNNRRKACCPTQQYSYTTDCSTSCGEVTGPCYEQGSCSNGACPVNGTEEQGVTYDQDDMGMDDQIEEEGYMK